MKSSVAFRCLALCLCLLTIGCTINVPTHRGPSCCAKPPGCDYRMLCSPCGPQACWPAPVYDEPQHPIVGTNGHGSLIPHTQYKAWVSGSAPLVP